jgi:hypothetical protein
MTARSADTAFATLKDFQRDTVDYVLHRLYDAPDRSHRFLVADEVGMGKTLVARGVIAGAIDRLQDDPAIDRIDIIYICSNGDIARQNIAKLDVLGENAKPLSTRMTMLATQLKDLNRTNPDGTKTVNLVAFTPGTSFDQGHATGRVEERALLHWLVAPAFAGEPLRIRNALSRLISNDVNKHNWKRELQKFDDEDNAPDETVTAEFRKRLDAWEDLDDLRELVRRFADNPRPSKALLRELNRERGRLIGGLRHLLARASVECLEPDLVILDEFQRFKKLLEVPDDEAEREFNYLAHDLFTAEHAKVLLLSATPYRMFTLPEEKELTGDDHYQDFLATARFLAYPHEQATIANLRGALNDFRNQIVTGGDPRAAKDQAETILRRLMCRTERPVATGRDLIHERLGDIDGPTADDLVSFAAMQRLAGEVGGSLSVEYWKSAPYFLNFMDGYQLSRKLRDHLAAGEAPPSLQGAQLLRRADLNQHRRIDPGNARLRALAAETVDAGMWKLLWLPPSLPYHQPGGAYTDVDPTTTTKRLIFSSWAAAPTAIASILSHQALLEVLATQPDGKLPTARRLTYQLDDDRPSRMTALALFLPQPHLAELTDPLTIARRTPDEKRSLNDHLAEAETAVAEALGPPPPPARGATPATWYAAAPFRLAGTQTPYRDLASVLTEDSSGGDKGLTAHLALADTYRDHQGELGSQPDDLTRWVTLIGLASPANSAWRAVHRITAHVDAITDDARTQAAILIADGFRSLFDRAEAKGLLDHLATQDRTSTGDDSDAYWQRILTYCANGNLQAVLDEYLHHLIGNDNPTTDEALLDLATKVRTVISLQTVTLQSFNPRNPDEPITFPVRFALRYGSARGTLKGDDSTLSRMSDVQAAFNSPFWPMVLASTSIGQEGVDFHWWCHSLIHWNQPANAVDIEQREGRVHRFKGHAIRKNVAAKHRTDALAATDPDPWVAAFEAAEDTRPDDMNDLWPGWTYPGDARVNVWIPHLPLSREIDRYTKLQRQRALYRIAIGQLRQETMLAIAAAHGIDRDAAADDLRIDLRPPRRQNPAEVIS